MKRSGSQLKLAGGLDLATCALILSGAGLVAASVVAAAVLVSPPQPPAASSEPEPAPTEVVVNRASVALPADRVATLLTLDVAAGAGGAARAGDHVDVLGYFPRQITGGDAATRVLLEDVPVLSTSRSSGSVAISLAVPSQAALLLQEAQALGAHPFVTLRSPAATHAVAGSFSDADLSARYAPAAH